MHRPARMRAVLDIAQLAVEAARRAGADVADARVGTDESEAITVRNDTMEGVDRSVSTGVGIRVLAGGRWGFAATARLDEGEITKTAELAVRIARAASRLPGDPVTLSPVEPVTATWSTPIERDPFEVPLDEKVAMLLRATGIAMGQPGVTFSEAFLDLFRR